MAKAKEVTVDIEARLAVSRSTAEACLKMVEMYVNNTGVDVVVHRQPDDTLRFEFEGRQQLRITHRDGCGFYGEG